MSTALFGLFLCVWLLVVIGAGAYAAFVDRPRDSWDDFWRGDR